MKAVAFICCMVKLKLRGVALNAIRDWPRIHKSLRDSNTAALFRASASDDIAEIAVIAGGIDCARAAILHVSSA